MRFSIKNKARFFILLSIFLFSKNFIFAQEQLIINWQKVVGGERNEIAYAGVETPDNGFIVVGSTNSKNSFDVKDSKGFDAAGGNDFWITKVSKSGALEWSKTFGGTKDDIATTIIKNKAGEYIIAGSSMSTDGDAKFNSVNGGILLIRIKLNGDLIAAKTISGGSGSSDITFAQVSSYYKPNLKLLANGQIILGASRSINKSPFSRFDFYLALLSSTGDNIWEKTFGGGLEDYMNEVIQTVDKGFLMVGTTLSLNKDIPGAGQGFFDFLIIKTDSTGKELWKKGLGGTGLDVLYGVVEKTDTKELICIGESDSQDGAILTGFGDKDGFLLKLNQKGDIVNKTHFGGDNNDSFYTIVKGKNDIIYCLGTSESQLGTIKPKGPLTDVWIMAMNPSATTPLYQKLFGGSDIDLARQAIPTSNGIFITASSRSGDGDPKANRGASDFWMINLAPPPPIIFGKFEAILNQKSEIDVFWTTTYENKSQYIYLDKSADNVKFSNIGEIFAAESSNVLKNYKFNDKNPIFGKNYYRLRYSDKSETLYAGPNTFYTFAPLHIQPLPIDYKALTYPNPADEYIIIESDLPEQKISLYSNTGMYIATKVQQIEPGKYKMLLPKKINGGLYIVNIENSIQKNSNRIIIQK